MEELSKQINDLQNEIITYKTNLQNKKTHKIIYNYSIKYDSATYGEAGGSKVQRLNFTFENGYSPFLSIWATGTINGKDISNPDNGEFGYRAVAYQGVNDLAGNNNETFFNIVVNLPIADRLNYTTRRPFDLTIHIKSLAKISKMEITNVQ